jgi:hypothetical protein
MSSISTFQKYSKGRYLCHNKVVILNPQPYSQLIKKIISSPKRVKSKLVLVKGSVVLTQAGKKILITNKPSKNIPTGVEN